MDCSELEWSEGENRNKFSQSGTVGGLWRLTVEFTAFLFLELVWAALILWWLLLLLPPPLLLCGSLVCRLEIIQKEKELD